MARQLAETVARRPLSSATDSWKRAVVRANVPSSALSASNRAASAAPAAPPLISSWASARRGAATPAGSAAASSSTPTASTAAVYRTESLRMSRWDLGKTGSPGFARSVSELSIGVRYRGVKRAGSVAGAYTNAKIGVVQLVTDGHYRAKVMLAVGALVAIGVVALARAHLRTDRMQERLLVALPDAVADDPSLVRFAVAQAKPLYARDCAACHGADRHGNAQVGAPDLTDDVWLYGDGSLYDIERTILYGARAGVSNSHDEAEMPAFGLRGV